MAYQHTLTLGTVLIEDFRILGHLGSGGFANTYLALDLTLGREVAIKEYFPSELAIRANTEKVEVKSKAQEAQFQWALRRFVREAKTLAKFRHPSVVRVFRVFNANDTAYIVLEFVRGSNMETWLKGLGRRPTQDELDVLLSSLLDALEVVHSAGILHRDIKPANIYIRAADQTPVLLDFGAARYASGDYAGTTAAIVSKGYSPHEAYATDSRLQGPWTDIYGLAATVYRALTGSAPLESTTRVLEDNCIPAVSIPGITGEYREDFLRAIDDGLRVMPRDRPQSIGEWRQRLMPDSSTNPRVLDANGDPTTIQEWRPISDLQSDAPTMDRPWSGSRGSSGGAAPSSGAKQSGGSSPSRGAVVGHSRVQMPKSGSGGPSRSQSDMAGAGATAGLTGAGTTRLMDRADDDIVDGRTSGGRSAAPTPEPRRSRSSGIVSRSSEPVSNRTFVIGIVFLLAGTAALAGQWLITRKPSQPAIEIAAPAPETARNAGGAVSSPPDETKRQREAAERAAAEAARLAEVERRKAEADRVALANAEAEKRAAEAEAQRVAAAEQRAKEQAEKKAESDRIARETAEAERLAAAAEAERKAAAEKRAREIAAADRRAKEEAERKAEAEKRAREVAAAERQAKEEAERKAEAEKRARELAEAERRSKEEAERRAAAEKRARELAEAERRS
ncbi:MAG: serine/threonine protein kinase, partial [Hyphomicrobiaceae bacterium]|nr:serine/threonine protein kinase [Hyphomicrobiaceae bacterium]